MNIDWMAISAAAFVSWLFSAAWCAAFAQNRMKAAGLVQASAENGIVRLSAQALVVSLVATFIMALILAGVLAHTAKKGVTVSAGMMVAAICWFGFVITSLATNYAHLRARLALTLIDGGHWLGVLLIQGLALGALL